MPSTFPRSPRSWPLWLGVALALALGCTESADVAAGLSASGRSEEDRARDGGRKPAEVVAFLGIEPGMTALDVIASDGWYTEVLSIAVGPEGKVWAQNPDVVLELRDGAYDKGLKARLSGGRLSNVTRADGDLADSGIPDDSVDVAITALNFHDVYHTRGLETSVAFLNAVHAKLRPGGVLGLIDHEGLPELDNVELHRIEKQKVLDAVAQSDFELESESDLLANAQDDHTKGVFAPDIRGRTDRFLLKLRKSRR